MIEEFKKSIKKIGIDKNHRMLLAVSGGVDSMVLWHLLERLGLDYQLAHVNFSLRAAESDSDEELIVSQAEKIQSKLYLKRVDTKVYANTHGLSIQMAAREIRYDWFDKLMSDNSIDYLLTAHHLDDSLETFFINLNRGTGLKGLLGISSNEKVIRPLLNFSKAEIRAYAQQEGVDFREDQSNYSTNYERNWFRHELIAPWKESNPQLLEKMKTTFSRLNDSQTLLDDFLKEETATLSRDLVKGYLSVSSILDLKHPQAALYYLLSPLGFSEAQLGNLIECLEKKQVGKQLLSTEYKLLVDREKVLVIKKTVSEADFDVSIEPTNYAIEKPIRLAFSLVDKVEFKSDNSKNVEGVDFTALQFPLQLRKWQEGDWMIPLGMKGKKKISDILIDAKVPLNEKEQAYVICSGKDVVCLLGHRIDERFKISAQTEKVFVVEVG